MTQRLAGVPFQFCVGLRTPGRCEYFAAAFASRSPRVCPLDGGMEDSEGLGCLPTALAPNHAGAPAPPPPPLNALLGTKCRLGKVQENLAVIC